MDTARALTENLAALLRREHDALAEFLVALAAFDHDRVWVQLGYPSLFDFLHRELRLSRSAAHYRKVAAGLIQQVPAVVEPLRQGRLCMTSVVEAARVVTAENCETVLPQFFGLSRREAMEVVAKLQPHPALPTRTVVTSPRAASPAAVAREAAAACSLPLSSPPDEVKSRPDDSPGEFAHREGPPTFAPLPPPLEVVPLSAEKRRVHRSSPEACVAARAGSSTTTCGRSRSAGRRPSRMYSSSAGSLTDPLKSAHMSGSDPLSE
jgi:hypothetical protein